MRNAYNVVIESADGIQRVEIVEVEGLSHALMVLRKTYSFDKWRVINIAAVPAVTTTLDGPQPPRATNSCSAAGRYRTPR